MDKREFKDVDNAIAGELARRQHSLSQPQVRLHQRILRHFADTALAPAPADLRTWADELGTALTGTLAELVALDLIECDADLALIRGAYPFTGHAAGYRVQIAGGVAVESYCALDSLGISAMLGKDVTVTSTDPHTSEPVRVEVRGLDVNWGPEDAVVSIPSRLDAEGPAAQVCCPTVNFFARPANAAAYQLEHGVGLMVLTMDQAVELAARAFGPLLQPETEPLRSSS
ncbi:MAG TPA: alkylmercury lyase family protein [Acidimicrobiales bacterium]|nr:alkylmercury lyase family protein [Acidimicrobiales bacterium]